jgi:hypothetical protein
MGTEDAGIRAQQKQQLEALLGVGTPDCKFAMAGEQAGSIGEFKQTVVAAASPVVLSTGTAAQVASLALSAGDWDVSGYVGFVPGATTNLTAVQASLSSTTAEIDSGNGYTRLWAAAGVVLGANNLEGALPTVRFSLAAPATIYLNAEGTFSISTLGAYGTIRARRWA